MPRSTRQSGTFLFYWLPVIFYCTAIFAQSAFPSPEGLPTFAGADKLLHGATYAILGILFFRACRTSPVGGNLKHVAVISILFASCYGISDEFHQYFVAARSADALDAAADIAGAAVGVCGMYILAIRSRPEGFGSADKE